MHNQSFFDLLLYASLAFLYITLVHGSGRTAARFDRHPKNVTIVVYGISKLPFLQSLPFIGPAIDLGVRDVNRQFMTTLHFKQKLLTSPNITNCPDLVANYNLVAQFFYSHQTTDEAFALFFAGCDQSTTIPVFGKEWNIPVFLTGTSFSNFRHREEFPTTITLGSLQYQTYATMTDQFLTNYRWTSTVMIYDLSPSTNFYSRVADFISRSQRHSAEMSRQMFLFPVDSSQTVDCDDLIRQIAGLSRVVFFAISSNTIRQFMISARQSGLTGTGEFVWVSIEWPQMFTGQMKWTSADNETSLEWFRSLFVMVTCYEHAPGLEPLLNEMRVRATRDYNVTITPDSGIIYPSEFTLTAYSSVQILAQLLNESLEDNQTGSFYDGAGLTHLALDRNFHLAQTGDMYVDSAGERQNRMCLMGFQIPSKTFEVVQFYERQSGGMQNTSFSIVWQTGNGQPPPNEPLCGFRGDRLSCRLTKDFRLIGAVTFVCILVCFAGLLTFRLIRIHSRRINTTWWLVENKDLMVLFRDLGWTQPSNVNHHRV